jgi:hypothetical protein
VNTFDITASMFHSIEHYITSFRPVVPLDIALFYRWPDGTLGVMAVVCLLQKGFRPEAQTTTLSG